MVNFEAFRRVISSSINLLFLKSILYMLGYKWDKQNIFCSSRNLSNTLVQPYTYILHDEDRPQKMAAVAIMAENFSDLVLPFTCFVGCLFPVT